MSRVYVSFPELEQIYTDCTMISGSLFTIQLELKQLVRQLDWDIRMERNVDRMTDRISDRLSDEILCLRRMGRFLQECLLEYRRLEEWEHVDPGLEPGQEQAPSLVTDLPSQDEIQEELLQQMLESEKKVWDALSQWMDKINPEQMLYDPARVIPYLEALTKYFSGEKEGWSGLEELMDLGEKSGSLWKKLYDDLKKDGENLSSIDPDVAESIGVIGSIMGAVSSLSGAADNISNTDGIGTAGIIGEFLQGGDGVVDLMEEIVTMGNDSKGIYTPSSLYASIAKGYISALGQAFKSYEDYSADREWSGMDTGATMVDASVDGLYSMVDALTFGLISEESTQVSADQISDSLKSWASGIGDRSAQYILSDPNLTRQYQESGELGKIFLTFYAAVKS